MHKNNFHRRRKLESNLGETVRIASIVQKGVDSGRSSYVEMRAIARQTNQNIRSKVHAIQPLVKDDRLLALLSVLPTDMYEGYTDVLAPNGSILEDKLDTLLSMDTDIATCLGIIESELKSKKEPLAARTLEELMQERKKFVSALKA